MAAHPDLVVWCVGWFGLPSGLRPEHGERDSGADGRFSVRFPLHGRVSDSLVIATHVMCCRLCCSAKRRVRFLTLSCCVVRRAIGTSMASPLVSDEAPSFARCACCPLGPASPPAESALVLLTRYTQVGRVDNIRWWPYLADDSIMSSETGGGTITLRGSLARVSSVLGQPARLYPIECLAGYPAFTAGFDNSFGILSGYDWPVRLS